MNFASLQFAGFLLLGLTLYALLRRRHEAQNLLLLAGSYYFYACWDVRYLMLIWVVTAASFLTGRAVGQTPEPGRRKRYIVIYSAFALAVLGYFKYCNFFIASAEAALVAIGVQVNRTVLDIVLPPAISFYIFESLSYVIEIHRGHIPPSTTLRHYALFIAYFPKLVAGPIERPGVLIPQLEKPRSVTEELFTRGCFLILLGLFKKVVIADGMALSVDSVFNARETPNAWAIMLGTYAFALQIYCDFSGYTDIARGVSKLFGIELSQNFRFPYFSSNPSEFWRRWHMSLSSWLRDYLYIPLGGSRINALRTKVNLMITMLLGGLWHGAAWNFILWGGYQGVLLIVNDAIRKPALVGWKALTARVLATVVFFQLVCYGWLLFRVRSFEQICAYTAELATLAQPLAATIARPPLATLLGVAVLALYDFTAYRSGRATFYRKWPVPLRAGFYATLAFLTLMGMVNARSAFIYFQF